MILILYPMMWLMFLIITVNLIANIWVSIAVMIASLLVLHFATATIGFITGDRDAFRSSLPIMPWEAVQRQLNRLFNGMSYADGWGNPSETKESPLTFGIYTMLITTPFLYMLGYDLFAKKSIPYFASIIIGAMLGFYVTRRSRARSKFTEYVNLDSDDELEEPELNQRQKRTSDEAYQKACNAIASEEHWSEILCVSKEASFDEINAARRELLKEYHPDKHRTNPTVLESYYVKKTVEINKAFEQAKRERK